MSRIVGTVGARLALLGMLIAPMPVVADDAFDKQAKDIIQSAQTSVQTIEIRETVRVTLTASERDVVRIRKDYLDSIAHFREQALADLGADTAQADISRVNNRYDNMAAQVDKHVAAYRANANLHFEQVVLIDFASGRARVEVTDLRDLPEVPQPKDPSEFAFPISKSEVRVELPTGSLRRSEFAPGSVTDSSTSRFKPNIRWLALGVMPAWTLEAGRRVVQTGSDGQTRKLVVFEPNVPRPRATPSKGAVVRCTCLPDKDDRLRQWVSYTADGDRLRTIDYADYRQVNGLWFPFEITKRLDRHGVEDYRVETRKVSEIRVNVPIDEERFQLAAMGDASPQQ